MIELILIYKWTLLAGVTGGGALSLFGSQLASRNQTVQTLVVAQAASFGVVIGLAVAALIVGPHTHSAGADASPLFSGFVCAFSSYLVCELLITQKFVSRSTYYIGFFALLSSVSYAVISLVPTLETHMAASYFGDLTVANEVESISMAAIGFLALIFMALSWRRVCAFSFESVTFGGVVSSAKDIWIQRGFVGFSLILVSASVQLLGLLFSLSCLFLPAMILVKLQRGIRGLALRLVVSSMIGIGGGFVFSLWHGSIPTVPCISIGVILSSLAVGLLTRMLDKRGLAMSSNQAF